MSGLLALIEALPDLFKLLNRLGDAIQRLSTWTKTNNISSWIDSLELSIDSLEKAKTPDEKFQAASALAASIHHLQ